MKKALIVGIDHYSFGELKGCVNDAHLLTDLLSTNEDGSPNFHCKTEVSKSSKPNHLSESFLKGQIKALFKDKADVALFYFSGHGMQDELGWYLLTQDAKNNDPGVSFSTIIDYAIQSPIPEIILIFDCCHSGGSGNSWAGSKDISMLREGITILSASRDDQVAKEKNTKGVRNGVLSSIIAQALRGGAADITGKVTIAGIYNFVDQLLGPWEQRPIFKSYVSSLTSMRECAPAIEKKVLRKLKTYFTSEDAELALDPSYEPTEKPKHKKNEAIFANLQKLRAVNLVEPVGEDHLYYAALNSKSCRLTPMGKFYWQMSKEGKV